jgi:hypothetical protein
MRWLLALHGDAPLPFAYGTLVAGAGTRVLRNAAEPEIAVARAEDYEAALEGCARACVVCVLACMHALLCVLCVVCVFACACCMRPFFHVRMA